MPGYRIAFVKQKAVSEGSKSEELLVACHEQSELCDGGDKEEGDR